MIKKGYRKFTLGLLYVLLSFATVFVCLLGVDPVTPGLVAAVAAACVSISSGMLVVCKGLVEERKVDGGG